MSAEGKKKRGVAGAANAKSIAFRYSGGGIYPGHLAGIMRSVPGLAEKCGRPRDGSAWDRPQQGLSYTEATHAENRGKRDKAA